MGIRDPCSGLAFQAFTADDVNRTYAFRGNSLERVDLNQSPRSPRLEGSIRHEHVDSAMCNADGVHLFHGNTVHHYASVAELTMSPKPSPPQNVTAVLFGCPH
ncbi:hypothetical protein KIL84_020116 [Mauremys mutica]|uniref:Uncharacterized protein n=1 Tax=Mauremys mutica TaxID=74926 RepID=A0A9D3XX04_9SAUR|nr:hypothetical protein KIL84_020116 [Mauremys mutica]